MRRPRRNENWRKRLLPRLRLRLLRLLRPLRPLRPLKPSKPLKLPRLRRRLRHPKRQQNPRLKLLRAPMASRRFLSETASPERVLPSQEQPKLQAGALPQTINEDPVEELDLEAVVVAVAAFERHGLDLSAPTDQLLNNPPLLMPSLLHPQLTTTVGLQCPTRKVARDVRWHPRMCTNRLVSLWFDD
jgi:hypothetical protein